jgi:hypothetical protein
MIFSPFASLSLPKSLSRSMRRKSFFPSSSQPTERIDSAIEKSKKNSVLSLKAEIRLTSRDFAGTKRIESEAKAAVQRVIVLTDACRMRAMVKNSAKSISVPSLKSYRKKIHVAMQMKKHFSLFPVFCPLFFLFCV